MKRILALFLLSVSVLSVSAHTSPNGKIRAEYVADRGIVVSYSSGESWQVIMTIPMSSCTVLSHSNDVNVDYDMLIGKKSHCTNAYNEIKLDNNMTVRIYNDGIAWTGAHDYIVDFCTSRNNWIQKWSEAYEDFFPKNRALQKDEHYAYPALFEYDNDVFALLSESCMTKENAATSMYYSDNMTFTLRPDGTENGGWQTMVIGSLSDIVESTLITDNSEQVKANLFPLPTGEGSACQGRSGMGPACQGRLGMGWGEASSWVHPGLAAWVYWAYNHGSNDYNIIKKYTDMAVKLRLQYVLIDAEWDNFLPPYTVENAVQYAVERGVSPIIWYSSSIGWIDGAPGPKFRLNKPEDREREFAWCEKIGIKGVKIDFFSGDSNQNIKFMIELLESAAKHHLLVNFHGATIPRGWQRTYPNLVSTEAVYGEEWYNNKGVLTNKAACHNATLPFTRNVIGSMDYTPCAFTDSQHPHITTHAHELALTALFESGVQHLADRPESFLAQPQEVQDYLTNLPAAWDETLLLAGYPGDYVVLARRRGTTWYIAGINGNDTAKTISIPTKRLKHLGKNILLFEDSDGANSNNIPNLPQQAGPIPNLPQQAGPIPNLPQQAGPWKISSPKAVPATLTLHPRGGFVIVVNGGLCG